MLKIKKIFILFLLINHDFVNSDLLENNVVTKNLIPNKSCFSYQPYLGGVDDIDSLDIKSDKFEITDQKILILNDNVEIDFPDGLLKAGKARLDQEKGVLDFKKNGDLFLEDYFFRSTSGSFNTKDSSINLEKGKVFLKERGLIFDFDNLKGNIDDQITINNVSMTSCANTSKGWEIIADKITLNNESKRGYANKVKVKMFEKNFLRLPILPFAISKDRMSGFLEPKISYSNDGLDFIVPYYRVLTNKSDITLALRNISDRALGLEGNHRSIHGEENNFRNIDFIYFKNDKKYSDIFPSKSNARWGFSLKDTFGNQKRFWVDLDWSKTSDDLLLRDIPGDITSLGNQRKQNLKQNIKINGVFKNFDFQISHEGYQTLNPILTNGYKKVPSIDLKYFKDYKSFAIHEHLNYTIFHADDIHGFFGLQQDNNGYLINISKPREGSRLFHNFEVSKFLMLNRYEISTSIGLKSISYDLNDSESISNSVTVPSFKLDISSLFLKKDGASLHILRPRIFYGYVGYEEQKMNPIFDTNKITMMNQLFSTYRYSGMDRIGDQNFYTLSFEYRKRESNMDKLSIIVSRKFYNDDKKIFVDHTLMPMMETQMSQNSLVTNSMVSMMNSDKDPLMIMGKFMPNKNTRLMFYGSYEDNKKKFPMAGITVNHKFKNGTIGYAKRYNKVAGDFNNVLNYSEFFANINLTGGLSIITKIKRDDHSHSKIESILGIGYENCCFAFRITSSDKNLSKYIDGYDQNTFMYLNDAWDNIIRIENKSRINFEFELKGLNSSFEKINRFINNSVFNY